MGSIFHLVWQRQPAVLQQRQDPALSLLLVIDGCHACSMRQVSVTKQDTFVSSLQQICAETVTGRWSQGGRRSAAVRRSVIDPQPCVNPSCCGGSAITNGPPRGGAVW